MKLSREDRSAPLSNVAYERRAAFRNAEDDGGNLTLWVINCREPRGS